jgi:hypothetical protein
MRGRSGPRPIVTRGLASIELTGEPLLECPRLRKLTSQAHALGSPLAQNAELFGQSICVMRDNNTG